MNKIIIVFSCLFFLNITVRGQSVRGKITDEDFNPLAYVNVILKDSIENSIIDFCQANNDGEYYLDVPPGKWYIEYSLLSYDKVKFIITVGGQEVVQKDVVMRSCAVLIDEVEITPQIPIQEKGDTIVFNVASFLRGNESVIEDVIRNLPGIEVSDNGIIYAYGKEIEKVLLEGDDLLDKEYSLLTKGLDALVVNQVELIDKYTENRLVKGIIETDDIVLNLKLEDSAKLQWIGMADVLVGNNKYEGHLNLLKVGIKNKHYYTTHLNNIGKKFIGDFSKLQNHENLTRQLIRMANETPNLNIERYNYNNEKIINGSNIWYPSDNIKIEMSNSINADSRNQRYRKIQEYRIDTLSYINEWDRNQNNIPIEYLGNFQVDVDIQNSSNLTSVTKFLFMKENNNATSLSDKSEIYEELKNQQLLFSQMFNYANRLSSKKLLLANAVYNFFNSPQEYDIIDNDEFKQLSQFKQHDIAVNVSHSNTFNHSNLIQVSIGGQYQNINYKAVSYDENIQHFNSQNVSFDLAFIYTYLSKIVKIEGGGTIVFQNIIMNNHSQSFIYPLPFINFNLNVGERSKILLTWSSVKRMPNWVECFPYVIRNSINTQLMGSGRVDLLSDMVNLIEYQYGNWQDIFLLGLKFSYIKSNLFYGFEQGIHSNIINTKYEPLRGQKMYSIAGTMDYYISPISCNLKLTGNYDSFSSKYKTNNKGILPYCYNSYYIGVSLKSVLDKKFNFDIGTTFSHYSNKYNQYKYKIINSFGNLYVTFDKIKMEIKSTLSFLKNHSMPNNSRYLFMDSKLTYDLISNKCSIFLHGNNLTNTNAYLENIYNGISHTQIDYNLRPRYILVGVKYRF